MPSSEFVAKYNDPVFHQIKTSFNERSDDFPILMLPVRLETKFMEFSRIINTSNSSKVDVNVMAKDIYKLVYDIRVWTPKIPKLNKKGVTLQISKFQKSTDQMQQKVNTLPEISRVERLVLRDAAGDLFDEVKKLELRKELQGSDTPILEAIEKLQKAVERIKSPSKSVYELGNKYLKALEALEKSIDAIFVSHKVNAKTLDAELDKIQKEIEEINSIADSPDFRATKNMMEKMRSKISFIKRKHKSGNIRLNSFKNGYTGDKDLKAEEYELRKKINQLQTLIQNEHVPVVRVKEELKTYPISHLLALIEKAGLELKSGNKLGFKNFKTATVFQRSLFKILKEIQSNSKLPLSGHKSEAELLKKKYAALKSELFKFQKKLNGFKPTDRLQKSSMTRMKSQFEAYLKDMRELEPGVKSLDDQLVSNARIRKSALSAMDTRKSMLTARDKLRKNNSTNQKELDELTKQLKELQHKIKLSASNTSILPRSEFKELRSAYFSLRDQVNNILIANPLPRVEDTRAETDKLLSEIENQILDQLVDVNDSKDRFFNEYKDRINFNLPTEDVRELWVRIYPDDIAIDNHDERLTEDEITIAQDFYYEVYGRSESHQKDAKLGAWRAAASSLGVRRAAYAIKILEPKEVKNGGIVGVKNNLYDYINKLTGESFLNKRIKKGQKKPKLKELQKDFKDAELTIKKFLSPSNFTPCLETKTTLDDALAYFRTLIDFLGAESSAKLSKEQRNEIQEVAKLINDSGKVVYGYYKENIVALNEPFKPKLTFPTLEKKTKSWDRAGITEALPDRFVVVTKRGAHYQHIVTGKSIQKPLPVSIDPSGDQAERFKRLPNGDLEIPEEINWLFDFDAAVDAGMAVRIPLDEEDFNSKFDLVMAFGVQDKDALESQKQVDKLFTNHLYSDGGLEFLPVGTPTNNTEQVKTPYRTLDNDMDGAFDLFFAAQKPTYLNSADDANELLISDGQFFKEAFGLPEEVADFIRHHEKKDIVQGRAMNRALYNATLKYYFKIMVDNLFTDNDISHTLLFTLHHVSALGTLPVFRVDNQPYGVLPVTPVRFFKAQGSVKKGTEGSYIKNLTLFLKQTKAAFEHFKEKPVDVNGEKYNSDPQMEYLKILGLQPRSREFFYRFGVNAANRWKEPLEGSDGFDINWDHSIDPFSPASVAANYDFLLKNLGHTTTSTQAKAVEKSPIYRNRFTEGNFILGNLVQDERLPDEVLAMTDSGKNYIQWLRDFSPKSNLINLKIEDLPKVSIDGEEQIQHTLLLTMLRGALVYDHSSYVLKALDVLQDLDVNTLENLMSSHIDLVSYRLDAWLTGLADYRLKELRAKKKRGTYLGAYGFVHDLERGIALEKVEHIPAGLESTNGRDVYRMPDNQGFIHGQSMNHAVTAAVLRAGYNSIKGKEDSKNLLSINLTSKRVRMALHLLEGVSNGQEIGALLGYLFERALHEKYQDDSGNPLELDVYIHRLRRKFPTYSDTDVDPTNTAQSEDIKATNVVDGLAVLDHIEGFLKKNGLLNQDKILVDNIIYYKDGVIAFKGYPWGLPGIFPDPSLHATPENIALRRKELRAIIHELDNMADAFDALGDLTTAEAIYQLVRGNHVRASAVLNSISEGKVPLDPEIIRSMRQGVMVTQRAILQVPTVSNSNSPWPTVSESPKSKAEPSLNAWLAGKIGDPERIAWKLRFADTETSMNLADLNLQAIDLVLLITAGGDDSQEELEGRCVDYAKTQGAKDSDKIEILFNENVVDADFSFGEVISLIQHLGKVIGAARAADARDYRIPEDNSNFGVLAPGIDVEDLKQRVKTAISDYKTLLASLSVFTATKVNYTSSEEQLAFDSLKELSRWGFAGFYPSNQKEGITGLAQRIVTAKSKMELDIVFAESQLQELELELDQGKWISFIVDFGTKFFGSGFKMLPKIKLSNRTEIQQQIDLAWNEGPLRNHTPDYLADWMSGISLVRDRLSAVELVSFLEDVLHGNSMSMKPVQMPFDLSSPIAKRDYWLGASYPSSYNPEGDRLSLLIFGYESLGATTTALMLDEWMEIIPGESETTGIAFHFNQPDARAPQNVLLAVPPEKTGKWDFEALGLCVEEAFNLAKLRAVEPDHIDSSMFSQLLPATATLAYGNAENARRFAERHAESTEEDQSLEQVLGYYIDFTSVNHGVDPK